MSGLLIAEYSLILSLFSRWLFLFHINRVGDIDCSATSQNQAVMDTGTTKLHKLQLIQNIQGIVCPWVTSSHEWNGLDE